MSLEITAMDLGLESSTADGISAFKEVIETKDDTPLGWSHDVDLFESVVKMFMVVEVLLRYGRDAKFGSQLEQLKNVMGEKKCHEFWVKESTNWAMPKQVAPRFESSF